MSYLQFEERRSESGKTNVLAVRDRAGGELGLIRWYGPWRKYTFEPQADTVFDAACLREIADRCELYTKLHRAPPTGVVR